MIIILCFVIKAFTSVVIFTLVPTVICHKQSCEHDRIFSKQAYYYRYIGWLRYIKIKIIELLNYSDVSKSL